MQVFKLLRLFSSFRSYSVFKSYSVLRLYSVFKSLRLYSALVLSIVLIVSMSACAPVCLAIPDTSFVAIVKNVDSSNEPKVYVQYEQFSLKIMLDEDTRLLDAMGNTLHLIDLTQGHELSIQGVLTSPNVVQASELRQLIQLN